MGSISLSKSNVQNSKIPSGNGTPGFWNNVKVTSVLSKLSQPVEVVVAET